jgi:hypothetical protein
MHRIGFEPSNFLDWSKASSNFIYGSSLTLRKKVIVSIERIFNYFAARKSNY